MDWLNSAVMMIVTLTTTFGTTVGTSVLYWQRLHEELRFVLENGWVR